MITYKQHTDTEGVLVKIRDAYLKIRRETGETPSPQQVAKYLAVDVQTVCDVIDQNRAMFYARPKNKGTNR